jgi:hypothetical protein
MDGFEVGVKQPVFESELSASLETVSIGDNTIEPKTIILCRMPARTHFAGLCCSVGLALSSATSRGSSLELNSRTDWSCSRHPSLLVVSLDAQIETPCMVPPQGIDGGFPSAAIWQLVDHAAYTNLRLCRYF